jgi:hypothetical protein
MATLLSNLITRAPQCFDDAAAHRIAGRRVQGGAGPADRDVPGCLEADPSTVRKHFFLKKEAKTFAHLAYAVGQRERLINKSFLVLFLKKELLPFVASHSLGGDQA